MKQRKPRKSRRVRVYWIEVSEYGKRIEYEDIDYEQWHRTYDLDGWVEMFYTMGCNDSGLYNYVMVF